MEKTYDEVQTIEVEDGKITACLLHDKPIKKSFMNALKKAQETEYWHLYTSSDVCVNPYTGVEVCLNAFEMSVFKWCLRWYAYYSARSPKALPISVYDSMKYLFLELNSQAYYDLLD